MAQIPDNATPALDMLRSVGGDAVDDGVLDVQDAYRVARDWMSALATAS